MLRHKTTYIEHIVTNLYQTGDDWARVEGAKVMRAAIESGPRTQYRHSSAFDNNIGAVLFLLGLVFGIVIGYLL